MSTKQQTFLFAALLLFGTLLTVGTFAPAIARARFGEYTPSGFLLPLGIVTSIAALMVGFALSAYSTGEPGVLSTRRLLAACAFLAVVGASAVEMAPMPKGPGSSTSAIAVPLIAFYATAAAVAVDVAVKYLQRKWRT